MKEARINQEQVSHIHVYDEIKGVTLSSMVEVSVYPFIFMPEKKLSWWKRFWNGIKVLEEGYYKNGKQVISNGYQYTFMSQEEVDIHGDYFIRNNEVWKKAYIRIFSSGEQIKRMSFVNLDSAKEYCDKNFPKCNVIMSS